MQFALTPAAVASGAPRGPVTDSVQVHQCSGPPEPLHPTPAVKTKAEGIYEALTTTNDLENGAAARQKKETGGELEEGDWIREGRGNEERKTGNEGELRL